ADNASWNVLMTPEYTETVFIVNGHYTDLDIPRVPCLRDYTSMEFCTNLRRYRRAKKWNQDELADLIGVTQAAVQRWETGKREPSHADLEKLARALGVTVADLFRDDGVDPTPTEDELSRMIARAMRE